MAETHNVIQQLKLKKTGTWHRVLAYAAGYGWVVGDRQDATKDWRNLRIIGVGDIEIADTSLDEKWE